MFLGQCCSVVSPGEVLCELYTQELGAAHSLHSRTIDGQRSMLSVHSPEVNNNLLHLLHIQREIVVTAPPGPGGSPHSTTISVADETHHNRVIHKFNEEVGVVWRCAVMGQQSEEEGAQHTSLGGPCVQCDGAGFVTADPYCLRSPGVFLSRCVRAGWRAVAMASSVERLDLYATGRGPGRGGEDRLDVVHD